MESQRGKSINQEKPKPPRSGLVQLYHAHILMFFVLSRTLTKVIARKIFRNLNLPKCYQKARGVFSHIVMVPTHILLSSLD